MNASTLTNVASPLSSSADISLLRPMNHSMARMQETLTSAQGGTSETSADAREDKALRKTAERFEALLLHTMLKGMRKTTLSENDSNERAVYNDMFDDRIATVVSESGRLGISDAIMRQLRPEGQQRPVAQDSDAPSLELRQILQSDRARTALDPSASVSGRSPGDSLTALNAGGIVPTRHDAGPVREFQPGSINERQSAFLQPLMAHADISARRLGTSPRAVLAVAALETGWGQHSITDAHGRPSHNLFGIKAQASDGESAQATTTEFINGNPETIQDRFKVYDSPAASVEGFADFILDNPRYATALQHASDPERFLVELQRAGYATDPLYAEKAISVMRRIDMHTGVSG